MLKVSNIYRLWCFMVCLCRSSTWSDHTVNSTSRDKWGQSKGIRAQRPDTQPDPNTDSHSHCHSSCWDRLWHRLWFCFHRVQAGKCSHTCMVRCFKCCFNRYMYSVSYHTHSSIQLIYWYMSVLLSKLSSAPDLTQNVLSAEHVTQRSVQCHPFICSTVNQEYITA